MRRTLVVMVKEPHPGRVKTRLGRDIGLVTAAWWYRHQTQSLLRRLRSARWVLVLAVSPDREGLSSRVWPRDLARWPQGTGDLGARMARMMQLARGPVCIIGSDIPGIDTAHVARAFAALGAHDAVLGPSFDGGYWLVGVKHGGVLPAGVFSDVRWSTEHALADTLATLPRKRVALIDRLQDVDTGDDLQ